MKKTFLAYTTAAALSLTIVNAHGQSSNAQTASSEYASLGSEMNSATSSSPVSVKEVSTKAQKNFTRDYKNISGTTWYNLKDGFVVYFTDKGINMRVAYDKKGNYMWTIRNYGEDKLPFEVRDLVKSKYYDLNIHDIDEVSANGGTAYTIKLEGKTTWKIIKVTDGEVTVVKDYVKN